MCGQPSKSHRDDESTRKHGITHDDDVIKHSEPTNRLSIGARAVESIFLFYRRRISPLKGGGTCRFEPTCSAYGLTAVRRFGAIRGTWLTFLRIMRCAPWHPGGWDPVPRSYPGLAPWWRRMHR